MEEGQPQIPPEEVHLSTTELRTSMSQIIKQVARREVRVIVERYSDPQAVLISPDDFQRLLRVEQEGATTTAAGVEEQASVVQIVTRLQAIVTDIIHTQVDDIVHTAMRRILDEYAIPNVPNPPNT